MKRNQKCSLPVSVQQVSGHLLIFCSDSCHWNSGLFHQLIGCDEAQEGSTGAENYSCLNISWLWPRTLRFFKKGRERERERGLPAFLIQIPHFRRPVVMAFFFLIGFRICIEVCLWGSNLQISRYLVNSVFWKVADYHTLSPAYKLYN